MYSNRDITAHTKDTAFNTDQLLGLLGTAALLPADYDFVELLPPVNPLVINYRLGGPAGVIVRQLTITWVGTDISTIRRTV